MSDEDLPQNKTSNHAEYGQEPVGPPINPILELLRPLSNIFVKQEIELLEIFCGCETNNHYSVKNHNGREIMRVTEVTNCCCRHCCGPSRAFTIIIDDFEGHEIVLKRNLACNSCFCCCCLNTVRVYSPPDQFIGSICQKWTFCKTKFVVRDENDNAVLRITGPCCKSKCCCSDVNFFITDIETGDEIGRIAKKWGGFVKEALTDADNFGIEMPVELDIKVKGVLIGATILIDFMFFEDQANSRGKTNN